MVTHIVLLSGPVASGKSTLCRALEACFGVRVMRTRDLLARNLGRSAGPGRKDLQLEGETLDKLTGGVWLRDELQTILNGDVSDSPIVVDAVRTLDQVQAVRDTYVPAVTHIHLTARKETLAVRYAARNACGGQLELPTYEHVRQNETERIVDTLHAAADIVIDTGMNDEDETFRRACASSRHIWTELCIR